MEFATPYIRRGFRWYVPRYLAKHFNAVRLARGTVPQLAVNRSVLCFANHPSWWDPLVAILLNERMMGGRSFHAPIDARALAAYPIFRHLGFFGIDLTSRAGVRAFLSASRAVLADPLAAMWITPAGKFCDVREQATFRPGLAHLAAHTPHVTIVPLAIEVTFWDERTPEILVEFGQPVLSNQQRTKADWQEQLQQAMAGVQASLAQKAVTRDERLFEVVLPGRAGVGGFYQAFRSTWTRLQGKRFDPRHRSIQSAEHNQ